MMQWQADQIAGRWGAGPGPARSDPLAPQPHQQPWALALILEACT